MVRGARRPVVVAAGVAGMVALVSLAGCTDDTPQTTTPTSAPLVWPTPTFVEGDCPMTLAGVEGDIEVTCGTMEVPEDRTDPESRTITLAVARLHSRAEVPPSDPVVQLEGGPGFSSLEDVAAYSRSPILDERDYILWDQRGTGYSVPNLDCPETNAAVWEIFATTDPPEDEGAVIEESLRACRRRVLDDGVVLDGYDTTQNAADLDDLRVALGIDEWNLRGISYGSALAIETIRNHPDGLRSVLLDSVVPPDRAGGAEDRVQGAVRAFEALYDACAADEACTDRYGDLEALFTEAADRLDDDPHETTVTDPATGEDRIVAITGQDLWAGLFNALYDETLIPALPAAARAIASGDNSIIDLIANDGIPFFTGQHEAMTASVTCADRARLLDPEGLDAAIDDHPELGGLVYLVVPETGCPEWNVEEQPTTFNQLLAEDEVDVPVLVMGGTFDPITPPDGTERVADALGVEALIFPAAGHGAVTSGDCARDIWAEFLDDPSNEPDTSCMDELGPPTFT